MNTKIKPQAASTFHAHEQGIRDLYMESLHLVERLHRRLLDVIKDEFDRQGRSDVNAIQALLLFNIGNSELTAGELRSRGYYLGSNVSYNVKKLSESGYLMNERSVHDRRSIRVRLTPKGRTLRDRLSIMLNRHIDILAQTPIRDTDLQGAAATLQQLERFWMRPGVSR